MTRISIVGGNGQIARLLIPLLVEQGHTPVALVRNQSYRAGLEALGAEVRLLDIENSTAADFGAVFDGSQAVVFAAGGGPDGDIGRKRTVDLEGSLKSIDGARGAGISRFVQISAINVDEPVAEDASQVWKAYVAAKRDSDVAVRGSGLDWTIIRPGRLTDEPGTGRVRLVPAAGSGDIPRADVAAVVARVIDSGDGIGRQWDLVSGEVPIAEATAVG